MLAGLIQKLAGARHIRLEKVDGETRVTAEPESEAGEQVA
jgi:hypothetical protein